MKSRLQVLSLLILAGALVLSGCSGTQTAGRAPWGGKPKKQMEGSYKIGNPYKVAGVWYYPEENFKYVETGIASWYGPTFHGKKTANGETYNQRDMTAAHRTLQIPSIVRVTNLENGKSVVVRVNDRGPYLRGRVIDLSERAAELLGYIGKGTARVRVEVLEKQSRQVADAAKRGMDTSKISLAQLDTMPAQEAGQPLAQPGVIERGPPVASLQNDASMMPESLQTPTITVEELSSPGRPAAAAPPQWNPATAKPVPPPAPVPAAAIAAPTHMEQGRIMPDAVVAKVPVSATGIFVQAGAFSVYGNAESLKRKLSSIGNAVIDPVTANGRTLYRVKLGPLPTVERADAVLEQVVRAGNTGARVIR